MLTYKHSAQFGTDSSIITGDHSKQDQILFVKKAIYIAFVCILGPIQYGFP